MSRVWIAGLASMACVTAARVPTQRDRAREIAIQQFTFSPAETRAAVGDTVTWVNRDLLRHTTTSDSAAWGSPELETGRNFRFVPSRPGRFPYHCAAHPVMRGVLVVQ